MATTDTLAAPHTEARPEVTRICLSRGWRAIDLREIWWYRELLWFLTLRDVKLRYKQTALGVAWAVIQPLFTIRGHHTRCWCPGFQRKPRWGWILAGCSPTLREGFTDEASVWRHSGSEPVPGHCGTSKGEFTFTTLDVPGAIQNNQSQWDQRRRPDRGR